MRAVRSFETFGTIRQATQGHVPNTLTFSTNNSVIVRTEHKKVALMVLPVFVVVTYAWCVVCFVCAPEGIRLATRRRLENG